MAVVRRTVKPSEASDINNEGVSTDLELAEAFAQHLVDHHSGGGVIPTESLPYYYDSVRDKNLSHQIYKIPFYLNSSVRRQYMNYVPGMRSSNTPYKVVGDDSHCIVGYELYMDTAKSGSIIDIQDKSNNFGSILSIDPATSVDSIFMDTTDITIPSNSEICAYVENTRLSNPVLILHIRQIYNTGV